MSFSESVTSAVWDDDFAHEANTVFFKSIEPAVAEIEEKTRANKYLAAYVPTLTDKDLGKNSCLALALSSKAWLSGAIAQRLVMGATVAAYAYQAHQGWARERAAIEGNQVYFMYRVPRWGAAAKVASGTTQAQVRRHHCLPKLLLLGSPFTDRLQLVGVEGGNQLFTPGCISRKTVYPSPTA